MRYKDMRNKTNTLTPPLTSRVCSTHCVTEPCVRCRVAVASDVPLSRIRPDFWLSAQVNDIGHLSAP